MWSYCRGTSKHISSYPGALSSPPPCFLRQGVRHSCPMLVLLPVWNTIFRTNRPIVIERRRPHSTLLCLHQTSLGDPSSFPTEEFWTYGLSLPSFGFLWAVDYTFHLYISLTKTRSSSRPSWRIFSAKSWAGLSTVSPVTSYLPCRHIHIGHPSHWSCL
jgi:hypothetical protein